MKVYKTKIKSNINNNSIEVTSPSGNSITVYEQQLKHTNLTVISLFYKLFKKNETVELSADDLKRLLEISKKPVKKERIVMFLKFDKRFPFTKEFNDDQHEQNYINSMERKGYKHIGTTDA